MKRLVLLCLVPLLAGCFAWDLDEKPLPWYPDPPDQKPAIGTVVWHGSKAPLPQPVPATFTPQNVPPAPAAPVRVVPSPPATRTVEVEVETAKPVEAAPVKAAKPDGATEKRLESLEQRLEELYQLILKSYEKKK